MNAPSKDQSAEILYAVDQKVTALREMTTGQFLQLGKRRVVYLKESLLKESLHDNGRALVVYGADGAPVAMADDVEEAADLAMELGLRFVVVH
jgi:hypothetical protein